MSLTMNTSRMLRGAAAVLTMAFIVGALCGPSTGVAQGQNGTRPVVSFATRTDTSRPVRELPVRPPRPAVLGQIFQRPFKLLPNRQGSLEVDISDPVVQGPLAELGAPTVEGSFEGINNRNGVLPPDPSGDIGPNHYVQMVNLSFAIYDRSGNTLYGPADNRTLWAGFGGPCEARNDGDPIVLYDHLANRWMMSQFALPNFPRGPFYQCIAVSQTSNPTGAWHRYEFTIHQEKLNDYPKFGVWPDGYYMSINQFKCSFIRCSWAGQGVVAFERDAMLAGAAARMVSFDLQSVDPNLGGMLPADLDGPAPPAGTPSYFAQIDDDAWGYSPDQLQIWQFDVDWANPGASTFTHARSLLTASFNANMCNYSRNCIPQPGGTKVDAISDRLMYRLQYRNFGSHQTLVSNHTVDTNGSDRAGIRWYELRDTGSGWYIDQQGTYAPGTDTHHRWMGSIAMNGVGDIALGYSKSSTSVYPSIVVTGRLHGDSAGFMTQPEVTIVNGGGSQSHSSGRWGDYSQMSVDPLDDCKFWYTQEYYASNGSASWRTWIGSVKLRDCGSTVDGDTTPPTASITSPATGATVSGVLRVDANASDNVGVTKVELYVDDVPQIPDDTSAPYEWIWDTTAIGDGNHVLYVKAYDAAGNVGTSATVTATVSNGPTVGVSLTATGYKVKGVQKADLSWSGATSTSVDVYRNGLKVITTPNDGLHTDDINKKGGGSYTYKICEAGTSTCSNDAVVSF